MSGGKLGIVVSLGRGLESLRPAYSLTGSDS